MKYIIPIIITVLLMGIATAELQTCLQPQANETSSCGGLNTGVYTFLNITNSENFLDDNLSTYFSPDSLPSGCDPTMYYVNWTKPANAIYGSIYNLMGNNLSNINITIPTDCFSQSPIQIKTTGRRCGFGIPESYTVTSYCYNSSEWLAMDGACHGTCAEDDEYFGEYYEDQVYWLLNIEPSITLNFNEATDAMLVNSIGIANYTNTTQIYLNLTNLPLGYNAIYFNGNIGNWSQKYEFNNDNSSIITETLDILDTSDTALVMQVRDTSGYVLEDAILRTYQTKNASLSYDNFTLTNQMYSTSEGEYSLVFDSDSHTYLTIQLSGYQLYYDYYSIGELDTSKTYIIYLQPSSSTTHQYNNVQYPITFLNRTTIKYGWAYLPGSTTAYVNTNFLGYNEELSSLGLDFYEIELEPDIHFNSSGTTNITFTILTNSETIGTYTIIYNPSSLEIPNNQTQVPTDIFEPDTEVTGTLYRFLLFLVIIIISLVVGLATQESNSNIGFHIYMIGLIIISTIQTAFLWVAFTCIMYYILRGIYKVTGQ